MKKLVRSLFAGAAIAMPLTMIAASPAAAADADVFVITGSGTITPGLGLVPTPPPGGGQSISFTGTATTVGTHGTPGRYTCSFSGTDINGSAALGVGTVSGNCGPIAFATCNFARVTGIVAVVCADPAGTRAAAAVCGFVPTDVEPTTRYTLACTGAYADA
ncbi:MAG TPA: hypothetical protein VGX28_08655 [Frankiaceae bacterium]|nr:hypothetical protein [Frankiaceae bacterium]